MINAAQSKKGVRSVKIPQAKIRFQYLKVKINFRKVNRQNRFRVLSGTMSQKQINKFQ